MSAIVTNCIGDNFVTHCGRLVSTERECYQQYI